MIKRVGLLLIVFASISVLSWVITNEDTGNGDSDKNETPSSHMDKDSERDKNMDTLINEVFDLSEEGRVLHTPFIAGETNIDTVNKKWGKPENKSREEKGIYESFPAHNVTVGYQDDLIVDVRSYHPVLHNINMNDIKGLKGEPDDIRFFKDNNHDQVTLTYTINTEYQLKWVLENDNEDFEVQHVSVYAYWTEKNKNKRMAIKTLEKMNLDEKIGQMIIAGIPGTGLDINTKTLINDHKIGGIIFYGNNLETPEQSIQLINELKAENEQNLLPLFLSTDEEGGEVSRAPGDLIELPNNDEIGMINDEAYSYDIGTIIGKELSAFGLNFNYAPVLDVNSNPTNNVIGNRSFGNNAKLVSKLGEKMMKGIQSEKVISVVKHFPGHGETAVDSHFKLPTVNKSLGELKELELIPFKSAIEHGADVVMVAHILLPQIDNRFPSSMSKEIITNVLREDLEYNGVIMTDDMTMGAITNNYKIDEAAVESVKAGSDIILVAHDYTKVLSTINALKAAVKEGEISEDRIDESVTRIIQLKLKYDLNDEKVPDVNIDELNQEIEAVLHKKE